MDILFYDDVSIPVDKIKLKGELFIPLNAKAIIIFSHGSGSSRFSRRNKAVAKQLHEKYIGTLLFDLLTEEENQYYYNRFDIDLLTKRLAGVSEWLVKLPAAKDCSIGYFGASNGASAALKASTLLPYIHAVVSRGGRPDLVSEDLHKVEAPTLLIVGSLDYDVLQLNKDAFIQLSCEKKLEIIPGAEHLFEEPGKMDIVCELAGKWFEKHLQPVAAAI
jgi:dienelactone hydrolase